MPPRIYMPNLRCKPDRRERLPAHLAELDLFPADGIRRLEALSGDRSDRGAHGPSRAVRCASRLIDHNRAAHFLSQEQRDVPVDKCGFTGDRRVARGVADHDTRGRVCSWFSLFAAFLL